MARSAKRRRAPQPWADFARRHAGHPFLRLPALYALSESLIDTIQHEAPGFFTAAEEGFERDLARTASFGFFGHRAWGRTVSDEVPGSGTERQTRLAKAIADLLGEESRRAGASPAEIDASVAAEQARREVISLRREAYIGWLVTNRLFREEVEQLRATWEEPIRVLGEFPHFPHWPSFDLGIEGRQPEELAQDFLAFYCRWGLQQLATWDWPIPLEPDLAGGMREAQLAAEAGLTVFLPWYVLRGEKLNVQEILGHRRASDCPAHLRQWVQKARRRQDELGERRYERLAWLYRFLQLALQRRYPQQCRRRVQKLDMAFSRVLDRDPQSVRRLRLELQRSLR